jgi:hypothetical protein
LDKGLDLTYDATRQFSGEHLQQKKKLPSDVLLFCCFFVFLVSRESKRICSIFSIWTRVWTLTTMAAALAYMLPRLLL